MEDDKTRLIPIRDFSKITGIPVSTLRYYDDTGLFRPAHREESGYRFYAPMQIVTVKFLRVLIDCGVPLKTIGALARERGPEALRLLLREQSAELDRELARLRENRAVLGTFLDLITTGLLAREDEIAVEAMPALPLRVGAENRFGEGDLLFYRTYVRFLGETPGIHLSYPVGGYFDDMARWVDAPSEPTRFFSIDPDGESEKPAGDYLVGYARGYYGETVGLPERMARYAKDKGLTPVGPVYNIYLHDEVSVKDESRYLMQASVAVRG